MALLFQPGKRFLNEKEVVTYGALTKMANGTATLEPGSIGTTQLAAGINSPLAAVSLGVTQTLILNSSTLIPANSTVLLPEAPGAAAGGMPDDLVYFSSAVGLSLSGYVQLTPNLIGGLNPSVRVRVTNVTGFDKTLAAGSQLFYMVQSSKTTVTRTTSGHTFAVTPGTTWAAHNPVTIAKLNASGVPVVAKPLLLPEDINGADLKSLAAKNVGRRTTFTVNSAINVPVGDGTLIGSFGMSPPVGNVVFVSQPLSTPIFVAFKSSSNGAAIFSIYANNQTFGTVTVPAGTVIKVIVV